MDWNNRHRESLYRILEAKWADLPIESFEKWLRSLGIKWAELHHENDAPAGTVAIWEGAGIKDQHLKMCWVVPDDSALKLLTLGIP